jgi:hypothetical protein
MHLLVAGKAHHRSGTFHSRHIFNGIDRQSRAGMRVVFDVTRYIWRVVMCSDMGLV